MLEGLRKDIEKLIAAYEAEKERRGFLEDELQRRTAEIEAYRKQIAELDRQIDNLKLKSAFLAAADEEGEIKARVERMLREIDRCISLLEK